MSSGDGSILVNKTCKVKTAPPGFEKAEAVRCSDDAERVNAARILELEWILRPRRGSCNIGSSTEDTALRREVLPKANMREIVNAAALLCAGGTDFETRASR